MATSSPSVTDRIKAALRRSPQLRAAGLAMGGGLAVRYAASKKQLSAKAFGNLVEIRRGRKVVRLSRRHILYAFDVIGSFDYYFDSIKPARVGPDEIVDYSRPSFHEVLEYDRHPILFPSLSEPFVTTRQYIELGGIKPGDVAIDLGAYSGLSAIAFKDVVGPDGRVVAVEADRQNLAAVERNFALYHSITQQHVDLVFGAVWRDNNGLTFSTEGSMGSSAADIVGAGRGETVEVPSFTLATLAERLNLAKVDFIKADIEGGEAFIFNDKAFFARFAPRIVMEPHVVEGELTTGRVAGDLEQFGYTYREVPQLGSEIPLLVFDKAAA